MTKPRRFYISLILLGNILMGQTVWATTYYVDRKLPGSDSNIGISENAPFLTVVKCVAVAINPGDTCLIKNGNYPEPLRMVHSGTAGNPITVANYPGHSPTLAMSGYSNLANQFAIASTVSANAPISWIVVQGLTIKGAYFGFSITNGDNIVLRENTLTENAQGILGNGYKITIDRNRIYHNGHFAECAADSSSSTSHCNKDHGVYMTGTYFTITNNLIYDNLAYGIHAAGYPYDPTRHPNPAYASASNWLIANNTVAYQNWRGGIALWNAGGGISNFTITNNILYQNAQRWSGAPNGIDMDGGGHTVYNNMAYATSPRGTAFISGGTAGVTYTTSGNVTNANPNFVDGPSTLPAFPDFSLQSGSPAIDKGLFQSIIKQDFLGAPRPQGSTHDIGAYESGALQSSTLPPSPPVGLRIF